MHCGFPQVKRRLNQSRPYDLSGTGLKSLGNVQKRIRAKFVQSLRLRTGSVLLILGFEIVEAFLPFPWTTEYIFWPTSLVDDLSSWPYGKHAADAMEKGVTMLPRRCSSLVSLSRTSFDERHGRQAYEKETDRVWTANWMRTVKC